MSTKKKCFADIAIESDEDEMALQKKDEIQNMFKNYTSRSRSSSRNPSMVLKPSSMMQPKQSMIMRRSSVKQE